MPGQNTRLPKRVANDRLEIKNILGAGCFGTVARAVDRETKKEFAVKFEDVSNPAQLEHEKEVMDRLCEPTRPQGFTRCYHFGREGRFKVLTMDFLGRSVEDAVQACGGTLQHRSGVLLAEQMVARLEYLHSKGIVHRDIKPENFVFGVGPKQHHLYLIDFGLCKNYWATSRACHMRPRMNVGLTGTVRYASINVHRGCEQSRRDDLEAVGHLLMYAIRGSLPWSGVKARSMDEKLKKIRQIKEELPLSELGRGMPKAFAEYLASCRRLGYTERPDYVSLRRLFAGARSDLEKELQRPIRDYDFEWNDGRTLEGLVFLKHADNIQQPDDGISSTAREPAPSCFSFWPNLRRSPGACKVDVDKVQTSGKVLERSIAVGGA